MALRTINQVEIAKSSPRVLRAREGEHEKERGRERESKLNLKGSSQ